MLPCFLRKSIHKSPYFYWASKQLRQFSIYKNSNNVQKNKLKFLPCCSQNFNMNRSFDEFLAYNQCLFSNSSSDVPDYLKEVANKVSQLQEDILEDNEELENQMENKINEFLLSRAISFEELDGSFIVICPSCGHSNKTHDMFIDKNSGYCVCPWCCYDGNWEESVKLFDAKDDCLTKYQLENFLLSVRPIESSHLPLLSSSPLMDIGIDQLRTVEAGITEDNSQVIFPLKGEDNERVGFASLSLFHAKPKVVKRVIEGKSGIFCGLPFHKTKKVYKRVVVVSNVFDALHLAKFKIFGVVLVSDPKSKMLSWIFESFKNVVIWLESSEIPPSLLLYVMLKNINTYAVKLTHNQAPIPTLSENMITGLISDSMPILSQSIITFHDIKNKVYERVLNKEEMFGTRWTRFKELNELLMGHREGELTVFSGQTGSGKTTFMSEYSIDLCMQGVCTLWGSFEVNVTRLCEIMLRQFSGKAIPESYFEFEDLASKFSELPLYFLDNHGQQPIKDVISTMTEAVLVKGVRHVIIDNLQFMLGLHGAGDWWLEQDRAVGAFRQFASTYNCHVTLIVHPRKLNLGEKLNLHSISGGARVTQEADNVMMLHVKENKDGSSANSAPKTLQIAKNRYGGTLGEMRLKFHKESLTLSSCFQKKRNEANPKIEASFMDDSESLSDVKGIPSLHLR